MLQRWDDGPNTSARALTPDVGEANNKRESLRERENQKDGDGGREAVRQKNVHFLCGGETSLRVLQVKRPEIDSNQEERVIAEGRITGKGKVYEEGAKDTGEVAVIA
ncbi:unnamed protein product [Pleuronectes platessa]|uniref:Uncharacterized protein n=1 Tax=Pleuronectes platessa TaxID=8262 RepID=A0A9N7TM26_PLEPL|nr:unnamed protein product [Pleuronectes platessa]